MPISSDRCCAEELVSSEIIARVEPNARIRQALDGLPPKMLRLNSRGPPEPTTLPTGQLDKRLEEGMRRIEVHCSCCCCCLW